MWQPIMTPTKVVLIFLAIGIAFVPTGVSLIRSSNDVSYPLIYSCLMRSSYVDAGTFIMFRFMNHQSHMTRKIRRVPVR
jgi:hypothetical protein